MDNPNWRGSGEQVVGSPLWRPRLAPQSGGIRRRGAVGGARHRREYGNIFDALRDRVAASPGSQPRCARPAAGPRAYKGKEVGLPAPVLRGLREQRQVFVGIAFDNWDGLAGRIGDRTDRVIGEVVTGDYFLVLGVPLFLGTNFSPNADGAAWEPSAIVCPTSSLAV